ncbi:cupin domain-containing protein [Pantoea sp. SIMBA_072]
MSKSPTQAVRRSRLTDMTGGWFIGDFFPAAYRTPDTEVAVQRFPAGYCGAPHHHRVATEVTLLLTGEANMAGEHLTAGDILTLSPGTSSAFEALTDCVTVVVKHPGVLNDKYPDETK